MGGAHRDNEKTADDVKKSILENLKNFENLSRDEIYNERKNKFLKIGRDQGFKGTSSQAQSNSLSYSQTDITRIVKDKKNILIGALVILILAIILMF